MSLWPCVPASTTPHGDRRTGGVQALRSADQHEHLPIVWRLAACVRGDRCSPLHLFRGCRGSPVRGAQPMICWYPEWCECDECGPLVAVEIEETQDA